MYTSEFDQNLVARDGLVLEVRSLRSSDAPLLARFFAGLSPASRSTFRPHTYTAEGAEEVVRAAAGPSGIYFLALTPGGDPAGYGFLHRLDRAVPILGIAVADAWQDCGIGRRLVAFLVGVARRLGKEAVDLTVDEDNPRAIHIYEANGFRLVRKIREMRRTLKEDGATRGP